MGLWAEEGVDPPNSGRPRSSLLGFTTTNLGSIDPSSPVQAASTLPKGKEIDSPFPGLCCSQPHLQAGYGASQSACLFSPGLGVSASLVAFFLKTPMPRLTFMINMLLCPLLAESYGYIP